MATATKQANFTLPEDLLDELKALVPRGAQSKVVGDALRNELTRIKFRQALTKSFGAWGRGRHPELEKGARQFVRLLRKSSRPTRIARS